jgi:tRNA threonylcarbamoyladenosine biosynthesis protein TsaB
MLLAIDASTQYASLALADDRQVVATRKWEIGQNHSVQIFDAISAFLSDNQAERDEIAALAIATGPGSFNGLRVVVTVAKTLSFVWNIPVIGVTTLDATAQLAIPAVSPEKCCICAASEAGRGDLYLGWYTQAWYDQYTKAWLVQRTGDIAIASPSLVTLPEVAARAERIVIAGDLTESHASELSAILGPRVQMAELSPPFERARGVAQLALPRLAAGDVDDRLTLEPLYVRRPNITTSTRYPIPPHVGEEGAH